MAHSIVITIKDGDDVVAIDQIPIDPKIGNKLIAKVEIVDVPPRARQKRDRNPLHPRALKLADLRVGMRIRVNHKDNPGWSYSAIVGGKPTTNEYDITVVPLVRLGDEFDYVMGYPEDMGLMRYVDGSSTWNRYWYTVAAE